MTTPYSERGAMVAAITQAITVHGPMTAGEIAAVFGLKAQAISQVVANMNTAGIHIPKRIYVSDWRKKVGGQSVRFWPVYSLGAAADKPPPGVLAGGVLSIRVNSVFALGDVYAGVSA
jgi:hypothetical protein